MVFLSSTMKDFNNNSNYSVIVMGCIKAVGQQTESQERRV